MLPPNIHKNKNARNGITVTSMPSDTNGKPGRALLTSVEKINKKSEIE